jgi:hypothetical protein
MSLQNWSLSKRLFSVVAILIVPIAVLLFFLVSEKDSLIKFTQQEISGVAYLRALQQGYEASLNQESSGAAQSIEQADQQDQAGCRSRRRAAKSRRPSRQAISTTPRRNCLTPSAWRQTIPILRSTRTPTPITSATCW